MALSVSTSQRYTRAHPCPICGGYESMRRRRGERCAGFLSADGLYARCEHSEYAGGLPLDMRTAPPTHNHYVGGPCKCGATHITGAASPSSHARPASATRRKPSPTPSPDRGTAGADRGETIRQGRTPEAVYVYTHADGTPAYKVERWRTVDTATGEIGKTFKPYLPDASTPSGWARRSTMGDAPHTLYHLRELHTAPTATRVWIVEGEKCADALASVGELATCNDGGAGKWDRCADIARDALAGRAVVILADNDGERPGKPAASYVGQRHALDVAASLADVAASVRVLMLPFLPIKGDVYDWLADGHTSEQLRALADEAPPYDPARPGVWYVTSREDWREGAWWTPDGAMPEDAAPAPSSTPAPAPMPHAPIELATHRRGSSRRQVGEGGPTGGDTGEPEAGSGLIELGEGLYCDAARTQLYRARRERAGKRDDSEPDGEGEGIAVEPVRFPAGMPRLLAAYTVGGEPDGDVTELTTYRYAWSGLPDRGAISSTEKDLNSGAIHARTPGLAITSRRDRDFWADVIKAQVIACGIPVGVAQDSTGWHQDVASGRWERHLRDGRIIQRPDAPGVPIAGLRFDGPHRQAWESDMATLPTQAPTGEGLATLAAFAMRADPLGRLLITMGAAMRGAIASFVPVATALLPVGQSRAGKTISSNFARGYDGPCPPRARADCVFTGTIPGLESSIAPLHDEFILIDDFHIKATDGPTELARMGNQLDMLITGGADGNDMRPRGSRTGKRRKESIVTAMLSLTGEGLPATTESRVLRAVILPYARGEMDTAYLLDGWSEHQRIWWSAGHAVMRWIGERVNEDMTAFRHDVEAQEATYKAHLLAGLLQACPTVDREALDTLAGGYARPALGLWLVTHACTLADASATADSLADTVLPFLLHYATIQARAIEMGGPGQASRQWILDALRGLIAEGRGHGLAMDNGELLKEAVAGSLADYGYSGTFPRGEHLFNRDTESGMTYWRTERLCAALADRASRARPQPVPWPWNAQTLPGYLVKLAIVTPEIDEMGNAKRAARLCYIATKRARRLAIPETLFIGEDEDSGSDEDDTAQFPYRGCEKSGSSGSSGSDGVSSRFNSGFVNGTAIEPLQYDSGSSGSVASGDTYSPDTVTYAPDADAEDARERAGWGDEDADAAPYAPPSETPDDPPDGETLAPVGAAGGELHPRQGDTGATIRKHYKPGELAPDGTPWVLLPTSHEDIG